MKKPRTKTFAQLSCQFSRLYFDPEISAERKSKVYDIWDGIYERVLLRKGGIKDPGADLMTTVYVQMSLENEPMTREEYSA